MEENEVMVDDVASYGIRRGLDSSLSSFCLVIIVHFTFHMRTMKNMAYLVHKVLLGLLSAYRYVLLSSAFAPDVRFPKTLRCTYSVAASPDEYAGDTKRSIGDVVSNLHGGKYQFENSYAAGSTRIGQEFAESLYASDDCTDDDDEVDEMPKWALRMMDPLMHLHKPVISTLVFEDGINEHTISIKNDERSWEKFYAFILPVQPNEQETSSLFAVQPKTGTLAPRGGASNACDANAPYSDIKTITVRYTIDGSSSSTDERMLVVGTEAEVWRYLLINR